MRTFQKVVYSLIILSTFKICLCFKSLHTMFIGKLNLSWFYAIELEGLSILLYYLQKN